MDDAKIADFIGIVPHAERASCAVAKSTAAKKVLFVSIPKPTTGRPGNPMKKATRLEPRGDVVVIYYR